MVIKNITTVVWCKFCLSPLTLILLIQTGAGIKVSAANTVAFSSSATGKICLIND
ncbi:hypothetical protein NSQ59_19880 [Margalitia sp. FSL K6-0131]|uniref:hypothetical protein n=1 Tax=Margalitia sp. FSL K6-0131 TaxID=2954604 RepID=UPI0030F5779C